MAQRLGIAGALLGDPEVLLFDEPINGLDPEGIRWVRNLLRCLAAEGRTVFVSSHLMSEMALTADHLVVIGRGRLIAETRSSLRRLHLEPDGEGAEPPAGPAMRSCRARPGRAPDGEENGSLSYSGMAAEAIGELAARHGIALHELTPERGSLEEAFMELTSESVEFHGSDGPGETSRRDRLAPVTR